MLNLNQRRKNRYLNHIRNDKDRRLVENQRRMTNKEKQQEKERLKEKKLRIKDKFENNNMGDFQNLYPVPRGVSKYEDDLMDLYDYIYFKKS